MKVTEEQIKKSVKIKKLTYIDFDSCTFCGYISKYIIVGDDISFDPGCDCRRVGDRIISWKDLANLINNQSNDSKKIILAKRFGIKLN